MKLADRAVANPDLLFLKDGTYAYFWDDAESLFETLAGTLKTAGLNRMIAMFNLGGTNDQGRLTQDMLDCIAGATVPCAGAVPWIGGKYCTPTPNLDTIVPSNPNWVNQLLLHLNGTTEATILAANGSLNKWAQLDTDASELAWKNGTCDPMAGCDSGLPYLTSHYGTHLRVIYHDTLPQQLGPSIYGPGGGRIPPYYVQTIDANKTGRQKILDDTHLTSPNGFGLVAGSGEGISAWWTVTLDYPERRHGGREAPWGLKPASDHGPRPGVRK